jgi:rhodanese-related sulfurtransferase
MQPDGLPLSNIPKKVNWVLVYNLAGLALILVLSIFVGRLVLQADDPVEDAGLQQAIHGMSPAEVQAEREQSSRLVILDVRNQDEWESGAHIPGAISLPLDELSSQVPALIPDKNTPIVVTCYNRNVRSHQAIEILRQQGYTQVFNLDGGLEAWMEDGLPIEPFVVIEQGG